MSQHRKTLTFALSVGIVLAASLAAAPAAQAQYARPYYYPPPPPPPPPPRGVYRSGLVWGFSLGLGGLTMPDCGTVCGVVGMGEIHIGGMVSPRLAIMGDFWEAGRYYSGDATLGSGGIYNGIYTLAAQFWLNDIIWVKGGIGFGRVQISSDYADPYNDTVDDESGFAFMLAAGIEIVQAYNFALDLQLRYGNVAYDSRANGGDGDANEFGVMIGFNWY
ncbi:MAG TPA: outer membrane beta-barrel protein [Polyangia bacterium]|nr:outer membrane beta-barrel protein [Polyangia bacterium]